MDAQPADQDQRADDAMRGFLGYSLKRAYMVLHQVATDALAAYDLRVRSFSALSLIVAHPGISSSELADLLGMERPNLVVIIDDLETREMISRTRQKTDRRRYALRATLRGRQMQGKAADAIRRADERLLAGMNDTERAQLMALLDKIEIG